MVPDRWGILVFASNAAVGLVARVMGDVLGEVNHAGVLFGKRTAWAAKTKPMLAFFALCMIAAALGAGPRTLRPRPRGRRYRAP